MKSQTVDFELPAQHGEGELITMPYEAIYRGVDGTPFRMISGTMTAPKLLESPSGLGPVLSDRACRAAAWLRKYLYKQYPQSALGSWEIDLTASARRA